MIGCYIVLTLLFIVDIITTDIALKNKCGVEANPFVAKFYKTSIIMKIMVIASLGLITFYSIVQYNNIKILAGC